MTCLEIRELLVDHVLGTASPAERQAVDEHLRFCAGCRRESMGFAEAAAVVGRAAGPAEPSPGLDDRVVSAVSSASGRRRRTRMGLMAAVLAAFVAVGTAGWGTVMAGRAQRLEGAAEDARRDAQQDARSLADLLRDVAGRGFVEEARLVSVRTGAAGGRALVADPSEGSATDWLLVVAGGLPERGGPYRARVFLTDDFLSLGEMRASDDGRLLAFRDLSGSTHGYDRVEVVDARGRVVLTGTFAA